MDAADSRAPSEHDAADAFDTADAFDPADAPGAPGASEASGASAPSDESDADALAARIFASVLGGFEALSVYVGDRLGLYRALADAGTSTPTELATVAGIDERYAREWLEQQAVAGFIDTRDAASGFPRFALSRAGRAVLIDEGSLAYSAPLARMFAAAAIRLPELLAAYRAGGGVSWAEFGDDARDSQGDLNRPWFEHELAGALEGVTEVRTVLHRAGARIADVGCGHGWSAIALARAYPEALVEGFDVDLPSIEAARRHADGVDNVVFHHLDGADLAEGREGAFDAAFVFEALHDLPDPVGVLSAVRRAMTDDGVVVIMDEAVADEFAPGGDEIERIMYGYSLFICLPDSMSSSGSVATGTVMRPRTLESYARAAGFAGIDILPIEGFAAFRFYRLTR